MVKSTRMPVLPVVGLFPFVFVLTLMGVLGSLLPEDGQDRRPGSIIGEQRYPVYCIAFAPDGKTLASGGGFPGKEGEVRLWDVATSTPRAALRGHEQCVYTASFSPDGRTLATTSFDGIVKLWDMDRMQECGSVSIAREYCGLPIAFSANAEVLAIPGRAPGLLLPCEDADIMLWPTAISAQPAPLAGAVPLALGCDGHGLVLCRAMLGGEFRPDCKAFTRAGQYHGLRIERFWDLTNEQEILTLSGHKDYIWSLVFSPNGRTLASAASDKTVRLWDVATGRERNTLRGHTDQVNCVVFETDGGLLATASHDRTVRLWDASTGVEQATFVGHEGAVTCVTFSPDSRWVASGSYDKSVRLWRLTDARRGNSRDKH
jgi:WD40 repeat protein